MAVKDSKTPTPIPSRKNTAPIETEVYKEESPSPFSIEGIRSGAVQSKVFKGFILLSGVVMAGGFIMTSLNTGSIDANRRGEGRAPSTAAVATVGNQNISEVQLENSFAQQIDFGQRYGMKVGVTDYLRSKQQALQGLTDNAANIIAAQTAGLSVSDAEVDAKIDELIAERIKPQPGQTEAAVRRLIEAQNGSVEAYKTALRKDYDRDAVSNSLLVAKLEKQVKADNKTTLDDYKRSVTKLKLWQIVVRPKLAPATDKAATQKNNAAAQTKATQLFNVLKATPTLANFQTIAKKSSDDVVTKAKGGDFGWKLPNEVYYAPGLGDTLSKSSTDLNGPFADANGSQYLFFIENRKTELPKDYQKNSKKLLADFETQKDNEAWQKKQDETKKAQLPDVSDASLSAYKIQTVDLPAAAPADQPKLRADALSHYGDALSGAGGAEAAAIDFQMAQLFRDQNERAKQQEALANAVKAFGTDANLRLEYARALREGSKPKEAIEQLKAASLAVSAAPSQPPPFGGPNPDDNLRQQIAAEFQGLKQPKLAAAEMAKVKPAAPSPMSGAGGLRGLPPGVTIVPPK